MFGKSLLRQKSHYLNKMGVKDLNKAYFAHYTVQVYSLLTALTGWFGFSTTTDWRSTALVLVVTGFLFPFFWYITHRWIMHGTLLWKSPLTAGFWKRIHYDHHQDPHRLEVLFGALYTTLPSVLLTTGPFGYIIDGWSGLLVAYAMGLFLTMFYEYVHCIQHLNFKPKNRILKEMKERHMMHHFLEEDGNFGITNFAVDRLFGTLYERSDVKKRSQTVNNLGYTEEEAAKYPWVASLSGGIDDRSPRDKRQSTA